MKTILNKLNNIYIFNSSKIKYFNIYIILIFKSNYLY